MTQPSTRPKLTDLAPDAVAGIDLWRGLVEERAERSGLWVQSPPRGGSSYAALAAVRSLGRLERYKGGSFFAMTAQHAYEDLRSLWDADKSDTPSFAEWASLDAEIHNNWTQRVLLLDDLNETVPTDFVMRWFYPKIRNRIKSGQPTVIATKYFPEDVARDEAIFFNETFVILPVSRHAAG